MTKTTFGYLTERIEKLEARVALVEDGCAALISQLARLEESHAASVPNVQLVIDHVQRALAASEQMGVILQTSEARMLEHLKQCEENVREIVMRVIRGEVLTPEQGPNRPC